MRLFERLSRLIDGRPIRAPRPPVVVAVPGTFLGRPALASRFGERRAVIGYVDGAGRTTMRLVTVDEVFDQNGHRYLSGYCHERFDRRHFRLDRITSLRRVDTGEQVEPAREVSRWLGGS